MVGKVARAGAVVKPGIIAASAYVRYQLRMMRDRDALLRAAHDDGYRVELFGPMVAEVAGRGSLRDEVGA